MTQQITRITEQPLRPELVLPVGAEIVAVRVHEPDQAIALTYEYSQPFTDARDYETRYFSYRALSPYVDVPMTDEHGFRLKIIGTVSTPISTLVVFERIREQEA